MVLEHASIKHRAHAVYVCNSRYHDDAQKKAAQAYIAEMNAPSSSGIHRKVVTPLEPKGAFYLAEEYHQQCA